MQRQHSQTAFSTSPFRQSPPPQESLLGELVDSDLDDLEIVEDHPDMLSDPADVQKYQAHLEEFEWLKQVYKGARSNGWWSNVFVISLLISGLAFFMLVGRQPHPLIAIAIPISLLAVYHSYEYFLAIEPPGTTEYSHSWWQPVTRTALYFPLYLLIFGAIFMSLMGPQKIAQIFPFVYRLNGLIYSMGLYYRMKTLADYLGNERLTRHISRLNAPFWLLIALLALRLVIENGMLPLFRRPVIWGAYATIASVTAIIIYINYYLIMKKFEFNLKVKLLANASRYQKELEPINRQSHSPEVT